MKLIDYAIAYAKLGWHVFPCQGIKNNICACGNPGCKSPGKHPAINNGVLGATTDESIINRWFGGDSGYNIGIATGVKSGFFVVDVDINHAAGKFGDESLKLLTDKYKTLPDTAEAITGGGGRHILFKCGSPIKSSVSKIGENIDIRGDGGYIIVEPSVHISGDSYVWEGSSSPLDGMPIEEAPTWLLGLMGGNVEKVSTVSVPGGSEWEALTDETKGEIKRALTFIPNDKRDTWLHTGMSIHALDPSHHGFDLWREWSESSKKFDMKDQVRVWLSFTNSKEVKLNYQSIFAEAAKHGYGADEDEDDDEGEHTTSHEAIFINYTPPVRLIQDVISKINSTTSSYTDAATTQAALAFCSLVAGRRHVTNYGESCGLFLSTASETLSEIRYAENAIVDLMFETGLNAGLRDSRFMHGQDLARAMYDSPNLMYVTSDHAEMVKFAGRQMPVGIVLNSLSALHNADRFRTLTKFELDGTDKGCRDVIYVSNPVLTMLSSMHNGDIATMLTQRELNRGATGQFIFAHAGKLKYKKNVYGVDISPIVGRVANVRGEDSMTPRLRPDAVKCVVNDDLNIYYDEIDAICVGDGQSSLAHAAKINLRKLITVLAACDDSVNCVATSDIVEWAAQYVIGLLKNLAKRIALPSGDDTVREQVANVIYNAGKEGITEARLKNFSRKYRGLKSLDQGDLLEDLINCGVIEVVVKKSTGKGRPSKRFVAC
jgi:hypothetical protein